MAHQRSDPVDPHLLERFTRLAAGVLDVPAARVSLVDGLLGTVVGRFGPDADAGHRGANGHTEVPLAALDGRRVGTLTVMGQAGPGRHPPYGRGNQRGHSDSGKGRRTLKAAIDTGVPAPVLSAALYERFTTRGESGFADEILSAMRSEVGGHDEQAPR